MSKTCSMGGCDNDAKVAGLCGACYEYCRLATKRGVAWIVRRKKRVALYETRLNLVQPHVAILKRRARS